MSEPYEDSYATQSRHGRRGRRKSKPGPLLPTVWFCVLGVYWWALMAVALTYLRPKPWTVGDWVVGGIGIVLGLFYFWVAGAVYRRRRYIVDVAFACAGLGLFSCGLGTIISLLLISSLIARKHDFTK